MQQGRVNYAKNGETFPGPWGMGEKVRREKKLLAKR